MFCLLLSYRDVGRRKLSSPCLPPAAANCAHNFALPQQHMQHVHLTSPSSRALCCMTQVLHMAGDFSQAVNTLLMHPSMHTM
jgi:hypothetical protein